MTDYAGGRWTRARMFSFIRSALRRASLRWPPRGDILKASRLHYHGPNKQLKWIYVCAICKASGLKGTEVQVDHITDCGTLKDWSDIGPFCERLFCEANGLRVICKKCNTDRNREKKNGHGSGEKPNGQRPISPRKSSRNTDGEGKGLVSAVPKRRGSKA